MHEEQALPVITSARPRKSQWGFLVRLLLLAHWTDGVATQWFRVARGAKAKANVARMYSWTNEFQRGANGSLAEKKSCYRKIYRLRIIPRRGYDGSPDSTTYRNYRFINRTENKI